MSDDENTPPLMTTRSVRHVRRVDGDILPFMPFGLAPLLGLLFILLFGLLPFARGWVQQITERTAQQALSDASASWATPKVSGQWVILEGTPPSREAGVKAMDAVRNKKARTLLGFTAVPATRVTERFVWAEQLTPVPVVDDPAAQLVEPSTADEQTTEKTAPAKPNPEWTFQLTGGLLRLIGDVPNEATRAAIVEAAEAVLDPPRVAAIQNDLTIADVAAGDDITNVALRGVRSLGGCDRGVASYGDDIFSLRCEAPAAAVVTLRALATASLPVGDLGTIEILANEGIANCEQTLSTLMSETKIEFASASAAISQSSNTVLDEIAQAASNCPGVLRIEGHTDNVGAASFNIDLSRRRAESVLEALTRRGVPGDRLVARGFGSRRPIADNNTSSGRARNRRIEIRVVRTSE